MSVALPHPLGGRHLARLSAKLGALNWLALAAGLVTGPILAHALGPAGRGQLAAILVPAGLATIVMGFGLGAFCTREVALGRPLAVLGGSVGALALGLGLAGFAAGVPLAFFLGQGQVTVIVMLLMFFGVLPINLAAQALYGLAVGLGHYRTVTLVRLTPTIIAVAAIPTLALLGELTVLTAAVVTLVAGLLSLGPLLGLARAVGRPRFDPAVARAATSYGLRAWGAALSTAVNTRLDQLLMVRLVSPHELGLYAVAVTVAALVSSGVSSMTTLLLPRVARGDAELVRRSSRVLVLVLVLAAGVGAAVTPVLLPLLFGEPFREAVGMALILLAAAVPFSIAFHLAPALAVMGFPGVESWGQAAALLVTVAALPLVVPHWGGEGAAVVSLAAYSVNCAIVIGAARRRIGGSLRSYLVVSRRDMAWLAGVARPGAAAA